MKTAVDTSQRAFGRRLTQVRKAARIKQSELARRIAWNQAVLSSFESGDRKISQRELETLMEAIGTAEALQISKDHRREFGMVPGPHIQHSDRDLLLQAEQVCVELEAARNDPQVRHTFERRLTEYIEDIRRNANLLRKREHDVAFIGSKGIGKSTAICRLTGLEVPGTEGGQPKPVLEDGGGGVTICDVHLRSGRGFGLIIEPCSDDEIRAQVTDFAEHIAIGSAWDPGDEDAAAGEGRGISQEMGRAVRNMAGLKVQREKGSDGKVLHRDDAKALASKTASIQEFVAEVLALMELQGRDRREIWYEPSADKSPMAWLKDTFEQVNNGRHPEFTIPDRIEVVVPKLALGPDDLCVRIVDTRGMDRTAARADLERHMDDPHTLVLLCSSFNDAPCTTSYLLLDRAKKAGICRLELNTALLVLPRANEALAVKDESGIAAKTTEEGYELKEEFALTGLEPLGLQRMTVGFFNAFTDQPAEVQGMILQCLGRIRQTFRESIQNAIAGSRSLLRNHKKEHVQDAWRRAALMMKTWIDKNGTVPPLTRHVQDDLMTEIQRAYAATVRATVRREGEWQNLSYGHNLGSGSRRLATFALEPLVKEFRSSTELMEANPEYAEAKDLLRQARGVLDSAFDNLLRELQIKGQGSFKEALKRDRSLWQHCEKERGKGYRNRVAELNRNWFSAEPRRNLEGELLRFVTREWGSALDRLTSLVVMDKAVITAGQP